MVCVLFDCLTVLGLSEHSTMVFLVRIVSLFPLPLLLLLSSHYPLSIHFCLSPSLCIYPTRLAGGLRSSFSNVCGLKQGMALSLISDGFLGGGNPESSGRRR